MGSDAAIERTLNTMQQVKLCYEQRLKDHELKLIDKYIGKYQKELEERYDKQSQTPNQTSWASLFRSVRPLFFPQKRFREPDEDHAFSKKSFNPEQSQIRAVIDFFKRHKVELLEKGQFYELEQLKDKIHEMLKKII